MRVSNIVKDYIRSEIEKKYPMENLPEYEDATSRISKFEDEVKAMIEDVKSTFLALNTDIPESALDYYFYMNPRRHNVYRPVGTRYRPKTDWELESNNIDHLDEIYKKREDAFNSIVVALELGGTKADLERMLSEL